MQNRRDFLKGIALAGAASAAGGAAGGWWPFGGTVGSPMHGYAAPAIPHIRLGIVGMGSRGCGIVNRASKLPGITITAICDNVKEKVEKAQKMLADKKKPAAKEYLGDTAWQKLCDDPNVDVVYSSPRCRPPSRWTSAGSSSRRARRRSATACSSRTVATARSRC